MSTHLDAVALSLRDLFMETIEQTSGLPFQDTGVKVPADEVWQRYTERAVMAFLAFAETDAEAAEQCEAAWLRYVRR